VKPLVAGDIVDVVAPGFRCSDENLAKGVEFVRTLGLVPRVPSDLFGEDLLCSNSDAVRFEQLKRALFAKDSRAVWCVRAGYGAIRFIERFRKLKAPRQQKVFIGYSDATTINHFLNHWWKWPAVHGPLLDRLGNASVRPEEIEELRAVLFNAGHRTTFRNLTPLNVAAGKKRTIKGRVFGGNLTVLQTTLGTRWQKNLKEILFLEDIGERGYRVDRMLQHFVQAGAFDNLKAIVLGSFTGGHELDGRCTTPEVWKRFAEEHRKLPVFAGMEAGHGEYQRAVCLNTPAVLKNCELTIDAPG
jgi:muramoyltetrapeptide carboxypeptidase